MKFSFSENKLIEFQIFKKDALAEGGVLKN